MSFIKFRILKDYGKWNYLSPEQNQIVALTSEVNTLKDHNLKLANQTKYPKSKGPRGKPKGVGNRRSPARRQIMRRSGPGRKSHLRRGGGGQSKQMTGFDKEHHWFEDHQAWVVHTPASYTVRIVQ
jgi:hypothetical protein